MTPRTVASLGVAASASYVVALALTADAPGVDAGAGAVLAHATAHPISLVVSAVLAALASTLTAAFLVTVAVGLWPSTGADAGSPALLGVGVSGIVIAMATVVAGLVPTAVVGFRPEALDPVLAQLLGDTTWIALALSGPPTAVGVLAFGVVLSRRGLRWSAGVAVVVVLAHLAVSTAFASTGSWTPSGLVGKGAPTSFILWMIVIAVEWVRRSRAVEEPAGAEALRSRSG